MNAQVIIIGGGVIGTACAYFLSRRGADVLLLERAHAGAGASGASAAIISIGATSGTPEPLRPFNVESYHLTLKLEEDFDQPLEIIRGGNLYAALDEREAREIRSSFEEYRAMGIDSEWLDGFEARRRESLLGPRVTAALFNPASYHLNPFRLYEGYLNAARRRAGRVHYGADVKGIKVSKGKIDRVITNRGDYYADWVVVAGGAHTPQILSGFGLKIPILPARGQVIITEPCDAKCSHLLSFAGHLYLKQTASGNFYLGSHTELVGFDHHVTLEKICAYTRKITEAVPLLARLRALRFFTGFRPVCSDDLPIIGPLPGCARLIIASGHGRTGVRYSASTGKAVSELIVDGKTEHPIDAFALDRFADRPDNL